MAYPATVLPRRDEILTLLRSGKRLSDLEPIIGVTDSAISAALSDDPEYRDALAHSFRRRLDKAEDGILEAPGKVDVSRASAYHRAIAWRAGVEHPDNWGQKPTNITINNNVLAIGDSLVGQASELLDKLRVVNAAPAQIDDTK